MSTQTLVNETERMQLSLDALDYVPVGVFVIRADLVVLFWNSRLEEWTGIARETIVGDKIVKHFPHLQDTKYMARLEMIFQGGPPAIFSSQFHTYIIPSHLPDGQARIQHSTVMAMPAIEGEGFYALFSLQDVTDMARRVQDYRAMRDHALSEANERKRAEEALRQRNQGLALLNQLGRELTATLDIKQLSERLLRAVTEIIDAQDASVWMWESDQKQRLVCQTILYAQTDPAVKLSLLPGQGVAGWVAQTGQSVIVPYAPRDPRFFSGIDEQLGFSTVSLLAVPLLGRGQVRGVLEVANKLRGIFDENDLVLAETLAASAAIAFENASLVETLRQQTAELQARNEELDAFAHTVAHDFKTPLGYMVSYAEVLEDSPELLPETESQRYLRTIAQSGRKAGNIIDELLLLTAVRQVEDVKASTLDMAGIVAEACARLQDLIRESQAELVLPQAWPVAVGQETWVEEVWLNYISNAVKYGGQPPRIELGATPLPDPPPLAGEDGVGAVRFWVRDNGPGLTPQEQAHLFAPFTRLDKMHVKGHGLGLSIVRRIVERLGGEVGVESQVGQGSAFWFTLPDPNP